MPRDEPLSAVDHAWLRMDRPTNLMMITSLIELEERLPLELLRAHVRERLLPHPRFTERVVTPRLGRTRWSTDPDFDLSRHVQRVRFHGGEAELRALVSELMSTPLDRARPLWTVHLVEDYQGGSALVVRLHHCIADGIALVRLLLELTDHAAAASAPGVGLTAGPRGRGVSRALKLLASLWRQLTLPADPPTALHGTLGVQKRAAWSRPAPLEAVHAAAHAAHATVTDVLVAALTGALSRWLGEHGAPKVEVRALVPVNLRRVVGGDREAGNRFGLVYLPLPIGAATSGDRLREVRDRMTAIKASPDAVVAFGVLAAMGLASVTIERFGIRLFTGKASAMITSVPGPTAPVRLAGRTIRSLCTWAPASGGLAVTLSLMSYRGEVRLGVGTDAQLVPEPQALADAFDDELRALTSRAA